MAGPEYNKCNYLGQESGGREFPMEDAKVVGIKLPALTKGDMVYSFACDGSDRLFLSLSDEWEKYDYVVALPRRCFNYAYIQNLRYTNEGKSLKDMISDIALLGAVKQIAKRYVETGVLPRVLFLDDVVLHGFALNKKIDQYVRALVFEICRIEEHQAIEADQLRKKIIELIDIRVLIQKDNELLMSEELRWKVFAYYIKNVASWHTASSSICEYLRNSGVAMTSFILSAYTQKTSRKIVAQTAWDEMPTVYMKKTPKKKDTQRVFYKNYGGGFLPTVRLYVSNNVSYYIPFVFHGDLSKDEMKKVFKHLEVLMREKNISYFADKMQEAFVNENLYVMDYYVQMAEMLLGQITLNSFLRDSFPRCNSQFKYDWSKIALNYDIEIRAKTWENLCAVQWSDDELRDICLILPAFSYHDSTHVEQDNQVLFERGINTAYQCGVDHLCNTEERSKLKKNAINPHSYFDAELSKDLNEDLSLSDWIKGVCSQPTEPLIHKALCIILYLIDNGFMALRMTHTDNTVGIRFCHTELTTSIYKAFLSDEWRKVCKVVAIIRWVGLTYQENLARFLIDDNVSFEERQRIELIGKVLSEYPQLYTELLTW